MFKRIIILFAFVLSPISGVLSWSLQSTLVNCVEFIKKQLDTFKISVSVCENRTGFLELFETASTEDTNTINDV